MPYNFAEKLFDNHVQDAGDHFAERRDSGRVFPSALFVPNPEVVGAAPARPRRSLTRSRGRLNRRRGEESRRDSGTRSSIAHGVAAQAGIAQGTPEPTRVRQQGARRRKTDQPRRGPGARSRRWPATPRERGRSSTGQGRREVEARRRGRRKARQGGRDRCRRRQGRNEQARARAGLVSIAARRRSFTCGATRISRGRRGRVFDATTEVPVTIRNPDKPIGTHVFTAMARNDAGLRWTAVTIDNGDDAKDALDRITIPGCAHRIAPLHSSSRHVSRETKHRVTVLDNAPGRASWCAGLGSMSPLRAATTGETTASASFSSAIRTPNLPIRVRAPANTINRRNSADGKTRHAARRPHGRSGSFSTDPAGFACRSMSVSPRKRTCGRAGARPVRIEIGHSPVIQASKLGASNHAL